MTARTSEGLLKYEISQLYNNGAVSREVAKQVIAIEASLVEAADCIFCCSSEDGELFTKLYGAKPEKMVVVPNGVFVESLVPPAQPRGKKDRLQAIFIGSNYQPNVDAAEFIIKQLAADHPDVVFVLAGGVGDNQAVQAAARVQSNIVVTGFLSDAERLSILHQSDFAVNPMATGSGTNIKMFDFMATGMPVIATPIGARGIATPKTAGIITAEINDFSRTVSSFKALLPDERNRLGTLNRELVCNDFAWETISVNAGEAIQRIYERGHRERSPRISGDKVSANTPLAPQRIGIISTYDIKCGIAGYAQDFADGLDRLGTTPHVFAPSPFLAERLGGSLPNVSTGWFYDDVFHSHSRIDTDHILEKARALGLKHINIQHHLGFFKFDELIRLLDLLCSASISSSITLHFSAGLSESKCRPLARAARRSSCMILANFSASATLRMYDCFRMGLPIPLP